MTGDVRIYESGSGGDMFLLGNDIQVLNGFENYPYIAMFGGNIESDTTGPKKPNILSTDYFGNYLLNPDAPENWYNSRTERTLKNVHLSPSTRSEIEQAVIHDLGFLNSFAITTVNVTLIGVDKVRISIKIEEPNSINSTEFVYIWDSTEQELTDGFQQIPSTGTGINLDNLLEFGL